MLGKVSLRHAHKESLTRLEPKLNQVADIGQLVHIDTQVELELDDKEMRAVAKGW